MKRLLLMLALVLCCALSCAGAEVSTRLRVVNTYNTAKMLVRQDFVDAHGNLTEAEDKGYATVKYTYEGKTLMRTAYYDAEGRLTNTAGGWAEIVLKRNGQNKVTRQTYRDRDGAIVPGPEGWAQMESDYYGKLPKSTRYLDAEGQPFRSDTQYASYEIEYKINGNRYTRMSETYLDADGRKMNGPDGWATVIYDRLPNDVVWRTAYYGADGEPMVYSKVGAAMVTRALDDKGQIVR